MCWFIIIEHEIHSVCGSGNEDDLEDSIVEILGFVKGPDKINVTGNVDEQVEELRLERYAGSALYL